MLVSTERMPIAEAVKLIRGPKGTVVTLKIIHEGQLLKDATAVPLTREPSKDKAASETESSRAWHAIARFKSSVPDPRRARFRLEAEPGRVRGPHLLGRVAPGEHVLFERRTAPWTHTPSG